MEKTIYYSRDVPVVLPGTEMSNEKGGHYLSQKVLNGMSSLGAIFLTSCYSGHGIEIPELGRREQQFSQAWVKNGIGIDYEVIPREMIRVTLRAEKEFHGRIGEVEKSILELTDLLPPQFNCAEDE